MDNHLSRKLIFALKKDPLAIILALFIAIVIMLSVGASVFSSYDPLKVDYTQALLHPSFYHLLGTDNFGRDEFTRLIHGGQASLSASLLAVALIIMLSLVIGGAAGYFGGWLDIVLTRLMDVLFSFPSLVLAIAIAALMGSGLISLMVAVAAVSWPSYARIFRSYVLSVKHEGFVIAAQCSGSSAWKIMRTHILGTLLGPVLVLITLDIGSVILSIASLSFLGLGIRPPQPEWGAMLNEGRPYLEEAPWLFLAPGGIILLMVLAFNYLGDTVKDALDPRTLHVPQIFSKRKKGKWKGKSTKLKKQEQLKRTLRIKDFTIDSAGEQKNKLSKPILELVELNVDLIAVDKRNMPQSILQNISLQLHRGQCLGLIGESGSGKSTLAMAIMGLLREPLRQISGQLHILGEDTADWNWEDWRKVRGRHISFITQDPMDSLNPVLKIGEQLKECLVYHCSWVKATRAEMKIRVMNMLEKTGLTREVYDLYPHQLSGGMRQRAVIAMAMINEPQVIIADEPTTALDVSTQARIIELLAALQQKNGATMIFVSHDLRLVAQVADWIAIMHQGRIIEQNDVQTIFTKPQKTYTKQLLYAIPRLQVSQSLRNT